jgi:hypothetical protein
MFMPLRLYPQEKSPDAHCIEVASSLNQQHTHLGPKYEMSVLSKPASLAGLIFTVVQYSVINNGLRSNS